MGVSKNVWQIVGYSNSGKTTLVEQLLQLADAWQKRVATIKHHGHGKKLTALDTGKDSWRHRQAGAVGCAVVADKTLQLQVTSHVTWQVADLLSFYKKLDLDAVIIEGYKHEDYKKIAMIRKLEDVALLNELTNVKAVVLWEGITWPEDKDIKTFQLTETEQIATWLFEKWKGE